MKNKPSYALTSVDNALLLLQMLRDQGGLRVSEAAEELGIARSTAHRLLSMLVYRDFAIQDDRRTYVPGPALAANQVAGHPNQWLRKALYPHMDALCERVQETVNLMVRVGTQTRFLASVESTQILHVGDRRGTILPAHLSSGGKALLAELERDQLAQLYRPGEADRQLSDREWKTLLRELKAVRETGYAVNREKTEDGVSAIGMCVHDATRLAVGALSVAAPSARFDPKQIPVLVREMRAAVARAEVDVQALPEL
ncbi:IclR family transcriptional regulator [Saccharopolyspora sp. 5N708]|uniref:IclR family transcriptional regulator n=1 Tax=Saccharopolyspora sp. 5N708 TaxID=3457424 RepID=UPI003FCFF021